MNAGQTLFSQLMDFLPTHAFNRCVGRYRGDHRVRRFSCRDQFLCMAFAQLTYRESLRDIETCLRSLRHKLYHAGFRSRVARNTLARANENRDWRIYADFAKVLIPPRSTTVFQRGLWCSSGANRLRLRLHHDRSLSIAVPMGAVPPPQECGQAPHLDRSAWQYPLFYACFRRSDGRREVAGPVAHRGGRHLCDGSRLHRLCPSLSFHPGNGLLHSSGEAQPGFRPPRIPQGRQVPPVSAATAPSGCAAPRPGHSTPIHSGGSATMQPISTGALSS